MIFAKNLDKAHTFAFRKYFIGQQVGKSRILTNNLTVTSQYLIIGFLNSLTSRIKGSSDHQRQEYMVQLVRENYE